MTCEGSPVSPISVCGCHQVPVFQLGLELGRAVSQGCVLGCHSSTSMIPAEGKDCALTLHAHPGLWDVSAWAQVVVQIHRELGMGNPVSPGALFGLDNGKWSFSIRH